MAVPKWDSGKESTCQCGRQRRPVFDPWVTRIPWSRKWKPTPVFLPEKFCEQRNLAATVHGVAESWTQLTTGQFPRRRCLLFRQSNYFY